MFFDMVILGLNIDQIQAQQYNAKCGVRNMPVTELRLHASTYTLFLDLHELYFSRIVLHLMGSSVSVSV